MGSAGDNGRPTVVQPQLAYAELFDAVQVSGLLDDSKTFVDALPVGDPALVLARYRRDSGRPDFDLGAFLERNFTLPGAATAGLAPDPSLPVRAHIDRLWDALSRRDEAQDPRSTLLELPRPYVVPGGRFREIYYWDSYFTMLGLAAAGRARQVEDMVENFAFLIDEVGFVPNGNRSYFCSRSQPPFFALMVELLAGIGDPEAVYRRYRPQLEREYAFWSHGVDGTGTARALEVDGCALNRYWDDEPAPRPESYLEDLETARGSSRDAEDLYRDIRAACESGWDFSSRWLEDPQDFGSIRTTQVVPLDLNCLLCELERVLAEAATADGDREAARGFDRAAETRAAAIRERFFDAGRGLFVDLRLPDGAQGDSESLACAYPLFCGIASEDQADATAARLRERFLQPGGWQTSLVVSGLQWDAPSGWAPLQWICYRGLERYGFAADAAEGARRWVENNLGVYRESGRLMERYDVVDVGKVAAGGEYHVQDGFGWTNGVLLRLMDELGID